MPGLIHVVRQLHIDDPEPLKILSFFTQDDAQKGEISEKNIISRVVNTLCDGSVEEQIQAQELLITLAKGVSVHHLTSAFMDSDALPVLLEMLKGKHKLKIKALRILRLLAKGHLMRRMIVDSDSGLATLVGMVKTGERLQLEMLQIQEYSICSLKLLHFICVLLCDKVLTKLNQQLGEC